MKKQYAKLLQDPRWINRSRSIREWDRNCCCLCGNSGKHAHLQVHHLYYDKNKNPWEYSDNALVTVCDECHKKLHKWEDKNFYPLLQEKLHELGELGYSKGLIISLLDAIIWMTRNPSCHDDLYRILSRENPNLSDLLLLHNRARKNNMYQTSRINHQCEIAYAKKAYETMTHKKDFNEDDYLAGYYDDDINLYRQEYEN